MEKNVQKMRQKTQKSGRKAIKNPKKCDKKGGDKQMRK